MAPKKQPAKGNSRKGRALGLLGHPGYDSEEDEDWTPVEKPLTEARPTSARAASARRNRDATSAARPGDDDEHLDEPLANRRRAPHVGNGTSADHPKNAKRPRTSTRQQPNQQPSRQPKQQATNARGEGRRRGATQAARAGDEAAAGPGGSTAAAARDWGGLTAALLAEVLRRACAASALPTAGAAPCVCRHWRAVCKDLEAAAIESFESATVAGGLQAAAEAPALTGASAGLPAGGGGSTSAGAQQAGAADPVVDRGSPGEPGLWSCLDVRCQPSVRFTDAVVRHGVRSRRWLQVHTLRLSNPQGLTPEGLLELARSCPSLTALELNQCDSLVKLDPMTAVLSSLPRLRLLDLSHCRGGMLGAVIKLALAPRLVQEQQQGVAAAAEAGGSGGSRGAAGCELPCQLRVLRARGCPMLGPVAFKALAPDMTPRAAPAARRTVPLLVHLTELDLTGSGADSTVVPFLAVEKLQAAAPNLRILRLDAAGSAAYQTGLALTPQPAQPGPGFPELRICEMGLSRATGAVNSAPFTRDGSMTDLLRRVVGRSKLLHTLDVSGAVSHFDALQLHLLRTRVELSHGSDSDANEVEWLAPAAAAAVAAVGPRPAGWDQMRGLLRQSLHGELLRSLPGPLRVLRASRSLLASDAGLHTLAELCGGTLKVVDVSESTHVTDAGLMHVAHGFTALTSLDVSSTSITDWGVRCVVALRCRGVGGAGAGGAAGDGGGAAGGAGSGARGGGGPRRGHGRLASAAAVIDLSSDTEDEGGAGGGGGGGLRRLDISSCRGVDRATRHAAAEGLAALRSLLRL